jgi:predicted metalloprotease
MRRLALIALTVLSFGLSSLSPAAASRTAPVITPTSQDDVIAWSSQQLDGYYKTLFALQGQEYRSPKVSILEEGKTLSTACGKASGAMQAFYCPADAQIVIGRDVLDWTSEKDDFVPAYVLAHEWAHHAQTLSGTDSTSVPIDGDWDQVYTIENELRADCMAGAWMGNIAHRGYINLTDFAAVLDMANEVGDEGLYGRGNSHGTNGERLRAVLTGYEEGIIACSAITPLPRDGVFG